MSDQTENPPNMCQVKIRELYMSQSSPESCFYHFCLKSTVIEMEVEAWNNDTVQAVLLLLVAVSLYCTVPCSNEWYIRYVEYKYKYRCRANFFFKEPPPPKKKLLKVQRDLECNDAPNF